MRSAEPLRVHYDEEWDVLHVDAQHFSGDFFRRLRDMKHGDRLEVVQLQGGKLTLKRLGGEGYVVGG